MAWRSIALALAALNILVGGLWLYSAGRGSKVQTSGLTNIPPGVVYPPRTNVVVRRQFFTWHELESDNYPTFIANLRDIGCPEQTIRDIIIADINALFAKRRATELITPDQQWWRSEPDSNVVAVAILRAQALDAERRDLLSGLLGPNWESGDLATLPRPSRPGVNLDGPVLGTLPAETKQVVQEISIRSQDRMQAYLEQMQREGKAVDAAEIARLRQQTRTELAGVLSPLQLEEFLLRYADNANGLRATFGELRYFNATPDEFRAVFRATDAIDQQIAAIAGTDPNSVQARRALETQRENALKQALGARRYEEYRALQDPLYREAYAAALEAGTPEAARTIYQVNVAAALEQQRINADTNLTAQQKELERKQLELDQLRAQTLATGGDLPPEPPPAPAVPQRRTYTIRQGDSLSVVALIYGVPPSAIKAANPSVDFNRLKPGESLTIPRSALSPAGGP